MLFLRAFESSWLDESDVSAARRDAVSPDTQSASTPNETQWYSYGAAKCDKCAFYFLDSVHQINELNSFDQIKRLNICFPFSSAIICY